MSHLYKCFLEKISSSMKIITIVKNNVTASKRWKRNSANVVKNKILFIMKIFLLKDETEITDSPPKILSNFSLISFSFFTNFSSREKSSIFLSMWKLLSSGEWLFCSIGKDCWNCSGLWSSWPWLIFSWTKFWFKSSLFSLLILFFSFWISS